MDHHRPVYHLTPPANWMNDPNGAIHWRRRYHLFYQHNPYAPESKNKHWAHVVSTDLLHWEELPLALAPTPGGYDKDGCFSGCMVVHEGVPTIIYTGVHPEVQCLATSAGEDLAVWTKHPANPVLADRPAGLKTLTFRDPYAWRGEDGAWNMLLGSGLEGEGGACLLYRSQDLVHWEFHSVPFRAPAAEFGTKWNCPVLFRTGGRHALIVAGQPLWKPFYFTGHFDGSVFCPQKSGLVDYGGNLYACQVFFDAANRPLFWGWIWEGRPDEEIRAAGWAGVISLPRLVQLQPDGSLGFSPAPEVDCLRRCSLARNRRVVLPVGELPVEAARGAAIELQVRLDPGGAIECGLSVLRAEDGSEQTRIGYAAGSQELFIDRCQAGLREQMQFGWLNPPYHSAPLPLEKGELLDLRIFIDHSVIEVYANHGICLSSRVYRRSAGSTGVSLFARGGNAILEELQAWELSL